MQVFFAFAQVVRDAGADDDAFRGLVFAGKSRAHGIRVFVGAQGEAAVAAVKARLQVFFAAGVDVVQREFAAQFAAACFGAVGEVLADADVHGVDAAAGDGKAAAAVFVHAAGFEVVVGEDGFRLPGEAVVHVQGVFAFGVGADDAGFVTRGVALAVVAVVDVARAFEVRLAVGEAAGEAEVAQGFDGVCANVVAVAFEAAVVAAVGFFAANAGGDAEGEVAGDAVADADAELVVVCFAVAGFQGVVVGEAAADGGVGFALAQGARVVVEQFAAGVLVRGEGRCRDGAVGVVRDGVGKVLVDGFFGLCVFRQVGAVFQWVVAGVAPGRGVAVVGVGVGGFEGGARRVVVAVQAGEAADGVGCSVRGRAGCRGVGGNAVVCAIGGVCGRAVRRGIYALAGLARASMLRSPEPSPALR